MEANELPVFSSPEGMVDALAPDQPVFCFRPQAVRDMAQVFLQHFPGKVLYAVKCNPGRHMLGALNASGISHFDTASLAEVELVSSLLPSAQCYFMHPVKSRAAIYRAYQEHGVRYFVVDHLAELTKLNDVIPPSRNVVIVVRLAIDHGGAIYELSSKFGADIGAAVELVRAADQIGYATGLAFHVGSQCVDAQAYRFGLEMVRNVVQQTSVAPVCIDVGGGFPGDYVNSPIPTIVPFLELIDQTYREIQMPTDCELLCEPGRALCMHGESLVLQVQLRKNDMIYLNDGMYGAMIEEKLGLRMPVRVVESRLFSDVIQSFKVFGPTCDALDVYPAPLDLPSDIREGDWIEFQRIGAYGAACQTAFNGFFSDTVVVIESDDGVCVI